MISSKKAAAVLMIGIVLGSCGGESAAPVDQDEKLERIRRAGESVGWEWREFHHEDDCGNPSYVEYVAFSKSDVMFWHRSDRTCAGGYDSHCFQFSAGPVSLLDGFPDWVVMRGSYVLGSDLDDDVPEFVVRIWAKRKAWEGAGETLEEAVVQAVLEWEGR